MNTTLNDDWEALGPRSALEALGARSAALAWDEKVAYLAYRMRGEFGAPDYPLKHSFKPGWYLRDLFIPQGLLVIGRRHRLGHILKILYGSLLSFRPSGATRLCAPWVGQTEPGYQAVFYAESPCVIRSCHPNPEEDRDTERLLDWIYRPVEETWELGRQVMSRLEGGKCLSLSQVG